MKTSIIATGASLKGFDFSKIKGHKIVVNNAYKYIDYDIFVALDDPKKLDFINDRLHTNKVWVDKYNLNCKGWERWNTKGINRDGKLTAFNGSLFAAINVALNLGFKEIDIYGADMALTDGYSHFYSETPCTTHQLNNYKRVFRRHRSHKALFESQLLEDERLNWINPQDEQFFNGVSWS